MSYDKSTKAMVDAARLADELRDEQGIACGMDKERRLLECQLKDLQSRLDEAETNALKVRLQTKLMNIKINQQKFQCNNFN